MTLFIHPALCQVNQIVSFQLIMQLWRRPSSARASVLLFGMERKTAGGTPAPQRQFDIWNSTLIMPQDFLKEAIAYSENAH